jgi:hypothetical protein
MSARRRVMFDLKIDFVFFVFIV